MYNFDLTPAWSEILRLYDFLRTSYISFFGSSVSFWHFILAELVCCALLEVFLYFSKSHHDDD